MKLNIFGKFGNNEQKTNARSKSIVMLNNTKSKTISLPHQNLKANVLTRIYAQETSPGKLSKNIIESISPKHLKMSKLSITTKVERPQKKLQHRFVSAKSEVLIKKDLKQNSLNVSNSKKVFMPGHNFISIENPSLTKMNTFYTLASCNSAAYNDNSVNQSKFLSTSQIENPSNNMSFHTDESEYTEFKAKLVKIFTNFKNSHIEILKKYDKS
ncbi:hypothetical protein SteCoe_24938 [Stentor coeruleus]|uniref:Uncharacterized protein n=1 Tax=Stentor coeruleus TaxID=5963 RepID=A0A1R2BGC9_9CILI|nr:hypothetical protein SteCoe_24938 [Stentor coeruleus]